MSTGTLKIIEHSVPAFGAEPMATAMHAELAVELQDLYACLPEMPAVALYYSGGEFHAFWPALLPASVRSRVREHLETHYLLGDLQASEGFYWAESFDAGDARLQHLDETEDQDIEPRTIRRQLMRLDQELNAILSQPEAMENLAAIAERESLDIAVVCALAARRWPHPASVSVSGKTTWSNALELTAGEKPERSRSLQQQFGDVCFSVVVPEPDALEALLTIDSEPESLSELDLSGEAEDLEFSLSLEDLFSGGELTEATDLEALFAEPDAPQATLDAPDRGVEDEALSLEALFGTEFEELEAVLPFEVVEQPVVASAEDESLLLESLFDMTGLDTEPVAPTPSDAALLEAESLPLAEAEEEPREISMEMLFAGDESPVLELLADDFSEASVELESEIPSLEMLFGDFSEEVWSEATPEVTAETSQEPLATGDLEMLFASVSDGEPTASDLEMLLAPTSDKAPAPADLEMLFASVSDEETAASDLEMLFASVSSEEPTAADLEIPLVESPDDEMATSHIETLFAEVSNEELATDDFETLFAEMDFDLPAVQDCTDELVELQDELVELQGESIAELDDQAQSAPIYTDLETLFAEPETVDELANLEHCVAILGKAGTGLFAGVIAFATHLDWITDAPLPVAIAAIEPHLDRMHCRMLHCPQPGETVEALALTLTTVPDHLRIKVGLGLPTGHSLYALSDGAGRRLFFHQQPGSEEPVLVHSWSGATDASQQLDWRAERFELLWSDRLQPHVRVEALSVNHEPLLALS